MTTPLIVRVAGLPAEVIALFSHDRLIAALAEREELGERLGETRAALVDRLHQTIRTVSREERRFLLSIKRTCFNAGPLKAFRQNPQWPLLAGVAGEWAEAVLTLEDAVQEVEARLDELYRRTLRRERESIAQFVARRTFMRGVALASPVVARNLDRLHRREPDSFERREKRLCLTLLRYASRAALKLSPFSTLTRTGLGLVKDDAPADFALLPAASWREKSTVSLRRELLAQCSCLLLRCPAFAEGLEVALNETLAIDDDGRCSLFRPGRWEFDDESRAFRFREASMVKARLGGPLVPWLISELRPGPQVYGQLLSRAEAAFDDERSDLTAQGMAGLLDIGFLSYILPWDFGVPDLERQILDRLDALPQGTGLEGFRSGLRELTRILDGYAETASPAVFLEAVQRGVESLFQALAPPAGLACGIEFKAHDNTFEEDVFLLPQQDRIGSHGIACLSRDRMDRLLAELNPLARLGHLYTGRHDLLHTLGAFANRQWPGAREVGLLEFFGATQRLFDEYFRHRARSGESASLNPGFNPLDCDSIRNLANWRRRVDKEIGSCFQESDPGQRLCPRALGALLDQVPAPYAHSPAFCAFLQPVGSSGEAWVLNAIADGYGRFGSRFTSAMDDPARERWISFFTALSDFELNGEPVELVDLACPGPRTANVHAPQTRRVLAMPGEYPTLPKERLLRLSDLRIHLRGADAFPVLSDSAGRRLFPVQLGSAAAGGRPTLLKFLAFFGPGELRWRAPVRPPRVEEGIEILDRHTLGQIVYSRKKWVLEPRQLLSRLEGHSELEAFASLNHWRLKRGIPDLSFVQEPVMSTGSVYRHKPQYIDFSSPSFVQLFRSMLRVGTKTLVLEEALPHPGQFPAVGEPWAIEVQLESFGVWPQPICPLVEHERNQQQPA